MGKYIISLDQGTTSSRAIIFDKEQNIISINQREITQHYPKAGYVEHDPMEIYSSQYGVLSEAIAQSGIDLEEIAGIGITNQRETTIVWDKNTGRPIHNAIVWQCRRTADICEKLVKKGYSDLIKEKTGLLIDAYFSGTKIKWLLDNVAGARQKAKNGDLLFGTVDTWLVWRLTGGKVFITDHTNASRTMIYNIHTSMWDDELLEILDIPKSMLPEIKNSCEIYGYTNISGVNVPIAGIAGDQQAALFGQTCFNKGDVKNTYGTGCFLLMNIGDTPILSKNGLLTTVVATADGTRKYALEGSVFTGGAVIQWLRDELQFFDDSKDSESLATKIDSTNGVYLVPAFTGLGAPHWDMYARGTIVGITRGTNRAHITRAALESIAYQSHDLLDAMIKDTGIDVKELRVDGGASSNDFLMQFQADITGQIIKRPMIRETTALGAAYLAGLALGFWKDIDEIKKIWNIHKTYNPKMKDKERAQKLHQWNKALGRAKNWIE